MLELRLLGPLQVRDGGRTIEIRRQKQRALLAALALQAGRVVSKDRLVDHIWGEQATAGAGHTLENYVSQLRKLLGEALIVTRAPGYLLAVDPAQVDVVRFERLVNEQRPEEALALVRGSPLADVASEPFAAAEIARLEELELQAREQLLALRLEQGRQAESVPELERLVAAEPYRERLRALLMLALYRSGRQADALAAYRNAREALVEGLGIEPGEELQELERAILRQDPSLRGPSTAGAEPERLARPGRKTVTVLYALLPGGRRLDPEADDPRREAARALIERHGGRVEHVFGDALVAVFGVPSVREDDAARAVGAAERLGGRVGIATGEVFVPGGAEPVTGEPLALAEALAREAAEGEVRPAETTRRLAGGRGLRFDSPLVGRGRELAAIENAFEDAAEPGTCQLVTLVGPPGVGKSRLIAEAASRLGDAATVLVLDDEHDAVEDAIDRLRRTPALILCAGRPEGPLPSAAVDSRTIVLEPLGDEESGQLIDNLLGETDLPPIVRRYIVGAAEGNPFFLEEFLASLIDRDVLRLEGGTWTTQELPALAVPPTIQALLAARIDRLPADERLVLELASVVGRDFDAGKVAELAPEELREEVPALLALLGRRDLVLQTPDGGHSFRHLLLRDAAYESMPKRTRADLHERLGDGEQARRLRAELDGVSAA
jgi:DNA-binding SARP family transcriptional activator